jgi:hypothetical protein
LGCRAGGRTHQRDGNKRRDQHRDAHSYDDPCHCLSHAHSHSGPFEHASPHVHPDRDTSADQYAFADKHENGDFNPGDGHEDRYLGAGNRDSYEDCNICSCYAFGFQRELDKSSVYARYYGCEQPVHLSEIDSVQYRERQRAVERA